MTWKSAKKFQCQRLVQVEGMVSPSSDSHSILFYRSLGWGALSSEGRQARGLSQEHLHISRCCGSSPTKNGV